MKSNFNISDGVLVYVEEYNKQHGTLVLDFIDSNEFNKFNSILNLNKNFSDPSVILITNYFQKRIQENTIYLILKETIDLLNQNKLINSNNIDSFIIGYEINLDSSIDNLFEKAISLSQLDMIFRGFRSGRFGNIDILPTSVEGNIKANIRNVGQGNWNELIVNDSVLIVFDVGAPLRATKEEVRLIIGDKEDVYQKDKPILFISHWDKDHYHSLIAMDDKSIASFSIAIFRDNRPTLTSRKIFGRFERILDKNKIISIPNEDKVKGKVLLKLLSQTNSQILVFNASEHKDTNRSGIVLLIRTKKSSIIFSGDIHYNQLSDYVLPHLNYEHNHQLIVPHHGGNAGEYAYKLKTAKTDNAIISVGKNRYGHPVQEIREKLKDSGFKQIKLTSVLKKDIEIDL